ncbi:MAG: DUF4340 domain-containing protein [Rhodothalassiaceae bacterium]
MNERQTTILGFATLILVLATIWLLFGESGEQQPKAPRLLFPGLVERGAELGAVTIARAEQSVELERRGDTWVVANRGDYPAQEDKIARLITGLARAERLAEKTARADRFSRIGLGEEALLVTLATNTGQDVAALAIGDTAEGPRQARFVRRPDEAAAWTASGLPAVTADPGDWIDPEIFDMDRERIARIDVTPPDAPAYTLVREETGGPFQLTDQAEAETLKAFGGADRIATALAFMNAEDVRPIDQTPPGDPWRITVTAFNGFTLYARLWPDEAGPWIGLAAGEGGGAPAAEVDGDDGEQEAIPAAPDPLDRAEDLNARWDGWLYRLPPFKGDDLTQQRSDLLEEAESDE